jgi:Phage integrase family
MLDEQPSPRSLLNRRLGSGYGSYRSLVCARAKFEGNGGKTTMGTRWGRSEHPAFGLEDSPERRDQDPEDDDDPGVVPIIEPLRFVLDVIKPEDASGWMFPNRIGGALDLDNLAERVIKPRFKANGLKWKGWHAYRRGLATNLHELGVPDIVIQAILRHEDIRTTQRSYIKTVPQVVTAATKRLES